jgi:hypothetical protein
MTLLKWLLAFLLAANTLASAFTTIPTKGRPVTNARSDAAFEYVSVRSLSFKVIFARLLTPMSESIHAGVDSDDGRGKWRSLRSDAIS